MMPGKRDLEIIGAALRSARHPEGGFISEDEEEITNSTIDGIVHTLAKQFGQQRHDFDRLWFLQSTETRR